MLNSQPDLPDSASLSDIVRDISPLEKAASVKSMGSLEESTDKALPRICGPFMTCPTDTANELAVCFERFKKHTDAGNRPSLEDDVDSGPDGLLEEAERGPLEQKTPGQNRG